MIYASAQHPEHLGICLFEQALSKVRRVETVPLVNRSSMRLHKLVVEACRDPFFEGK